MTNRPRVSRAGRVRRLLADLARPSTRGEAMGRVRRRLRTAGRRVIGRGPGVTASAKPTPSTRRPSTTDAEWSKLAATLLGPEAAGPGGSAVRQDRETLGRLNAAATRNRADAAVSRGLARGEPLEAAIRDGVSELAAALFEWEAAWSLAEGVGRVPGGRDAAAIGRTVMWHRRRQFARAWTVARAVDDAALAGFIPVEAVDAALGAERGGDGDARARALAIGAPNPTFSAATLVDLAGRFLAAGERTAARDLLDELARRDPAEAALDVRRAHARDLVAGWLDAKPVEVPAGAVPIAVLDYQSPDHVLTSGNLGDYIQTLGMLGTLARFRDVAFAGEDGLGAIATALQDRVRPDDRVRGPRAAAHLFALDRDFSGSEPVPPGTWMFAFGWHMHPLFDLRYDFPYHPNVQPLFLSFHVNRLDMLSDEALAYLRANGPIGCRDWSTVDVLLSAGVEAFFSGCFTTTLGALFADRSAVYRGGGPIGVIDLPAHVAGADSGAVREISHQSDAYTAMSLAEGLRAADTALATHQRELALVVTNRLHAYLPLTAIGVPVEFRPGRPGDIRFAGLFGLTPGDDRITAMARGLRELVDGTFERILAGATPAEVRARWRELTVARVEEAKARFARPGLVVESTIDVDAIVSATRARARRFNDHDAPAADGNATNFVLAFDEHLLTPAAVLLESIVANATGPLRLFLLGRGLSDAYVEWLAAAFPSIDLTYLPCDGITYGPKGRPHRIPARITISTMDRLLLPDLLPDVSRIVYLDVDTLALADVGELARLDLDGRPIAARDTNLNATIGWQAALRPSPEPVATEFRRWIARRHGFGHASLNAGVLVLDLDRMRRDGFVRTYLPLVEQYGLHDQDVMLAYAGPDRAVLDPAWNALPMIEDVTDPKLIHWAALGKPWNPELTFGQDLWAAVHARLRARAGDPPGASTAPAGTLRNPIAIGPTTIARSPRVEAVIRNVRAEHLSYLDVTALRTLAACVEALEASGVPGLIVETGTARGGSAITMAAAKSPGRRMRVYDVFGMIPPPTDKDGEDVHDRYETIRSGQSTGVGGEVYYGYRDGLLEEVTESFARHGVALDEARVELIRGLFEDTIRIDEPVALAHLDGDWYESTMTCLRRIVPQLAVGGRIVVDDYDTWSGCRRAIDEYFDGRPGFRFERRGRLHIVRG